MSSAIVHSFYNKILQMSEQLEREVLARLKKTPCPQESCASENQDNV
jgi:hypothetical protein